jgi:hypothetical protein
VGIIISSGRQQQANDLPIFAESFCEFPSVPKTPQSVGCSNYGGREERASSVRAVCDLLV